MKNIGVVVKNLTSGGAEKQSVLLAKALTEDFNVHYIIFNAKKVHDKYIANLKVDERIIIHTFNGNFFSRIKQFYCCLRIQKIEILFSYLTMANVLTVIIGRCAKVGQIHIGLRNAFLPFLKLETDKFICNYLATTAISNSFSGKEYFIEKGFKKGKIKVIPNCFTPIAPYSPKPVKENVRIITVGRFVKQKDYETAIHAISIVKKCADIEFIIVGYGELEKKIRLWIKEYKVEDITKIKINPDNIPQLELEADIYLSTSIFEGTSNSIMEGMNANMPIVCTNVGDNNQLVRNGENGFLCEIGNYNQIAEAIKDLIKNADKRCEYGKRSKEILVSNYGTEFFRQQYIELINLK